MRVFVFEWITGGGLLETSRESDNKAHAIESNLLSEGLAMATALVEDFARAGHQVTSLHDYRFPPLAHASSSHAVKSASDREEALHQALAETDACLLIAPESDGILLKLAQQAEQLSPLLLSPPANFIAIASDKRATEQRLRQCEVPTTKSLCFDTGACSLDNLRFPVVTKPCDGVGAEQVCIHDSAESLPEELAAPVLIQPFHEGRSASVAVISDGGEFFPWEPCLQQIQSSESTPKRLAYTGGRLPLEPALATRARELACQAMAAMPSFRGYAGVDMILGQEPSDDIVIEINPRLTTSYVGLRAATETNLAEAMLAAALQKPMESIEFDRAVSFDADGSVTELAQAVNSL